VESFASRVREEVLSVEAFDSLPEAKIVIEEWRDTYNSRKPHSSLGVADASRLRARPEDLRQADSQGEETDERGPVIKAGELLWALA
jgi:transposase InsO family protein